MALSDASPILPTRCSSSDVNATTATPTTVVIISPFRAILRAVAEYAPVFNAAPSTLTPAAARVPLRPQSSIAPLNAFARTLATIKAMLSPFSPL